MDNFSYYVIRECGKKLNGTTRIVTSYRNFKKVQRSMKMNLKVKSLLKRSALLSAIGYSYRGFKVKQNMRKYLKQPLEQEKLIFATTEGRFNDSCKPMAEYLHRVAPELKLIWVCKVGDYVDELPSYIKPVIFDTQEYYKELSTSSVWVYNYLIPQGTIKRNGQLYIQVWHGDKPIKRIGNDAAVDSKEYRKKHKGRYFSENELCDLFLSGSDIFIPIWRRSFDYQGQVLNTGLPRNDILVRKDEGKKEKIRKNFNISPDTMVLSYAPTFRDHQIDIGTIGTDIDLNKVIGLLEKKYNKKWICLMRAHGGKAILLEYTKTNTKIIDVTEYPDMTDILTVSDMLITDYSSCAGDFALTGNPVILYQDDYKIYTSRARSLVFEMDKTPFMIAHNMKELENIIEGLTKEKAEKNDKAILELYESTQTNHSTEDICKIILDHIKKTKRNSFG